MNRRLAAVALVAALAAASCSNATVFDSVDLAQTPSSSKAPATTARATTTTASPPTTTSTAPATSGAPAADSDPGESYPAEIELVDCPGGMAGPDISCGLATVLIKADEADSPTTKISFVVMEGFDPQLSTPVAVLQGGPGGASSDLSTWFPPREFAQVFVDQRGTGFGTEDFDCPEIDEITIDLLALDSDTALEQELGAYSTCSVRLAGNPVLAATNTAAMAADVESVMAGLGHDRWVVYGVSYGTTIALELLRRSAKGLVAAVIDGVYPPDLDVDVAVAFSADHAIDIIDSACRADQGCSGVIDGVSSTLDRLMNELDNDPIVVAEGGGVPNTILDGQRLAFFTFLMLYSEREVSYVPWMLAGIDRRNTEVARWTARLGSSNMSSSSLLDDEATYFAVQCHDRAPFASLPPDDLSAFAAAIAFPPITEACGAWSVGSATAAAVAPVDSDIPTLLLSGGLDPITPATYARGVAQHLSNSTIVEQGGRGHGIWPGNDCIGDIVLSFVTDPTGHLDTSCAAVPVPVDWVKN